MHLGLWYNYPERYQKRCMTTPGIESVFGHRRQAGPLCELYDLITYMAFEDDEVPLSYPIKDPGANGTASEQFFFGNDCHAFNVPQTGLGGGWKQSLICNE